MIVYGIAQLITNNVPIGGYRADYIAVTQGKVGPIPVPIGGYRADYIAVTQGKVGPIPLLFIYLIIAAAIFWFVYNYTRHGKYMYAVHLPDHCSCYFLVCL